MNTYRSLPVPALRGLLPSLVLLAASGSAQLTEYAGEGFGQVLVDYPPGAGGYEAQALVTGQLGEAPWLADLVLLLSGTVVVNFDAAERGRYEEVTTGALAVEVVSHPTGDVLYSTDGTELYRHDWNGAGFTTQQVGSGLGGGSLRTVRTGSGNPGLAVVEADGSEARYMSHDGSWTTDLTLAPTLEQGQFYATERLFFDVDATLDTAVVTDRGVEVLGTVQQTPILMIAANGALLEAIPASATGGGRDLLVAHGQGAGGWLTTVYHSTYTEYPSLSGSGRVGAMVLADWLGNDGRADLVAAMEGEESLYLLQHGTAAPYFDTPDPSLAERVDLTKVMLREAQSCPTSISAVPLAAGDLDDDGMPGDVDLALVTNCNELVLLPQEAAGMEDRPWVPTEAVPDFVTQEGRNLRYVVDVSVPANADLLRFFVYWQPNSSAKATALPAIAPVTVTNPEQPVTLTVPATSQSPTEIFQIQIRAEANGAAFPAITRVWSPDNTTNGSLRTAVSTVYPWGPWAAGGGDPPGGTVQRPRIDPISASAD